jgi:5'-nucleotidase
MLQTLGNHEFDDKIAGVVPFLEAMDAPFVVANIDDSKEPSIQGKYQKSITKDIGNRTIGIIGYILNTTNVSIVLTVVRIQYVLLLEFIVRF